MQEKLKSTNITIIKEKDEICIMDNKKSIWIKVEHIDEIINLLQDIKQLYGTN